MLSTTSGDSASTVRAAENQPHIANTETTLRDVEAAARTTGLQIQILKAGTSLEIDAAFATLVRERSDALFVGNDPFFTSRRVQLAILAAHHSIPSTYGTREIAEVGGLMSFSRQTLRHAVSCKWTFLGATHVGNEPDLIPGF